MEPITIGYRNSTARESAESKMSELSIGSRIVDEINQRQEDVLLELDQLNQQIEQVLSSISGNKSSIKALPVEAMGE